jgi:hypothetical protein
LISEEATEKKYIKVNLDLSVAQIAKKYGLVQAFETLEGQRRLSRIEQLEITQYSVILAKD